MALKARPGPDLFVKAQIEACHQADDAVVVARRRYHYAPKGLREHRLKALQEAVRASLEAGVKLRGMMERRS